MGDFMLTVRENNCQNRAQRGTATFMSQAGIWRTWPWPDELGPVRQRYCRSRVEPMKISKPGVLCAGLVSIRGYMHGPSCMASSSPAVAGALLCTYDKAALHKA